MSSSTPGHSPPQPIPLISLPPSHSGSTTDRGCSLSHLEQIADLKQMSSRIGEIPTVVRGRATNQTPEGKHKTGCASHVKLVASRHWSKLGFRRRLLRLFKRESNGKKAVVNCAATLASADPMQHIAAVLPEVKVTPVALDPLPSTLSDGADSLAMPSAQVDTLPVSNSAIDEWLHSSPSAIGPLRLNIFPENVAAPVLATELPKPHARIEKTSQLVYCFSLLYRVPSSSPADVASDGSQATPLSESQREWVQTTESFEKNRVRWLVDQLVKSFAEDQLKGSAAAAEIVLLGPILDRETYRSLLSCFITKFEQTTPLDITVLQGLVQLVECASSGYLVDNDLVRIATVLFKELEVTHNGASDHPLHLTLALSRIFDVMVAGKVKDLNRERDHQPMLQLLDGLKGSDNKCLKYQAVYAHQALQYAPDDETPLQVLMRYAKVAAAAASTVSSVFKLDPAGLLEGIEGLQKLAAGVAEVVKKGVENFKDLRECPGEVVRAAESKFDFVKKLSWYLALQGTSLFIRQGRLSDFNRIVCQVPCRHNVHFQWGICRQLGEIALDPLWDTRVRLQAIDFLGELYRSDTDWKPHADVKRWILTILVQISELSDPTPKDRAHALLEDLRNAVDTEFPGSYPLRARLPLPETFPLLDKVQEIPKVEYALHTLMTQRLGEYKQLVYIPPLAKPSVQTPDDTLFPLMEKVEEFLAGNSQVMLVLGDSGAGKSTFNRHLEYHLWKRYQNGGRIPLFINLPSLERPEKELIAEQLRIFDFSEEQVQELKLHRQFMLICDGYDERQLVSNLHTTNLINQSGQCTIKLLISCRTQYLGPDYRDRFVPKATAEYYEAANDLFVEAVITPFSNVQIEKYVERYVPLEPRTWVKEDYMDKLMTIPNLMDLVKNPFLLTLALDALPSVVRGESDLSNVRVTRVQLYDTFVDHWLGVNRRRLQDHRLKEGNREALEALLADGFERNGILYQKELATAIFQEQDGKPVVEYSHIRDRKTWKTRFFGFDPEIGLLRDSSLLCRAGNQYRFVHRSILEYFFSCTISDLVDDGKEFVPQDQQDPATTPPSIDDHPLSQRNLVKEPSIIQFLAERVQLSPVFKQHLLDLIGSSKTDSQAGQAAANAISILVKAGIRFHGADLRGIRIPGADLSGGQFDSVQLQATDLTGVNFTKSWIRKADLSNARLEEVQFGEFPYVMAPSSVYSCAYSPDGKTFAAGLDNSEINIYNTTTWATTHTFQGHQVSVTGLAYSPSGHKLLSGSKDRMARLWNCETGLSDFVLEGHTDQVTAVAFSPTGKQVATASFDKTARLWDTERGGVVFVLTDHTDRVHGVSYSPDGQNIASGSLDGTIRIFNTQTGQPGLVLKSEVGSVYCIAYSPDGQRIVSGHGDGKLQLWEAATGKPGLKWAGHGGQVRGVNFSSDGQWIASSSYDSSVKLWSAHDGILVSTFTGHSQSVSNVVFSPCGSQIASGSDDRTIRLWDVNSIGAGLDVHDHSDPVRSVAYSPDGQSLLARGASGTLRQYNSDTGEPGLVIRCGALDSLHVAYSMDGLLIATAGWSSDVAVWSAETGLDEFVLRGHTDHIESVTFSPCGRWIATGSKDKTIRLWDAHSGTPGLVLTGHSEKVRSVAFSPNGLQVVSGSEDGTVQVWDVETGGEPRVLVDGKSQKKISDVAFSPDGLQVASKRGKCDCVELWGEKCGSLQHTLQHDSWIKQFAFSSCGRWIVAACGREVWVWKSVPSEIPAAATTDEWSRMLTVRGFIKAVESIAWRPYSWEFVTGCEDGSVRVWKLCVETSDLSVQLVWSAGYTVLVASDAVIANTTGLSAINQQLLEQRGAIVGSSSLAKKSV